MKAIFTALLHNLEARKCYSFFFKKKKRKCNDISQNAVTLSDHLKEIAQRAIVCVFFPYGRAYVCECVTLYHASEHAMGLSTCRA